MGAAITSATLEALDAIKAAHFSNMDVENKAEQIIQALDRQLAQRDSTADRICHSFSDYVRDTVLHGREFEKALSILTLSSSSTISSCITKAASDLGIRLDLRVLESRPLFEGVTSASRVLKNYPQNSELKVTLYSDASAGLAADGIEIVLLGADRFCSAGDVKNVSAPPSKFASPGSPPPPPAGTLLIMAENRITSSSAKRSPHRSKRKDRRIKRHREDSWSRRY